MAPKLSYIHENLLNFRMLEWLGSQILREVSCKRSLSRLPFSLYMTYRINDGSTKHVEQSTLLEPANNATALVSELN